MNERVVRRYIGGTFPSSEAIYRLADDGEVQPPYSSCTSFRFHKNYSTHRPHTRPDGTPRQVKRVLRVFFQLCFSVIGRVPVKVGCMLPTVEVHHFCLMRLLT